jgi:hypothetical protein
LKIWLVVCAVSYEPVSTENSLLSGNLTGNFAISGLPEPNSLQEIPLPQPLLAQFPMDGNRDFVAADQGISNS